MNIYKKGHKKGIRVGSSGLCCHLIHCCFFFVPFTGCVSAILHDTAPTVSGGAALFTTSCHVSACSLNIDRNMNVKDAEEGQKAPSTCASVFNSA